MKRDYPLRLLIKWQSRKIALGETNNCVRGIEGHKKQIQYWAVTQKKNASPFVPPSSLHTETLKDIEGCCRSAHTVVFQLMQEAFAGENYKNLLWFKLGLVMPTYCQDLSWRNYFATASPQVPKWQHLVSMYRVPHILQSWIQPILTNDGWANTFRLHPHLTTTSSVTSLVLSSQSMMSLLATSWFLSIYEGRQVALPPSVGWIWDLTHCHILGEVGTFFNCLTKTP